MSRHIVQSSETGPDGRRFAAAALRNAAPILQALSPHLPAKGRVLEIASGTGQHMASFAAAYPDLEWVPSDVDAGQRDSISAWQRDSGLANFADPLAIDIAEPWPVEAGFAQAVVAINLLHLVPDHFVPRLFDQAHTALSAGGRMAIYGPFKRADGFASDGDRSFDASLRDRDPAIGYKMLDYVRDIAVAHGLQPLDVQDMPANNLLLTFTK